MKGKGGEKRVSAGGHVAGGGGKVERTSTSIFVRIWPTPPGAPATRTVSPGTTTAAFEEEDEEDEA